MKRMCQKNNALGWCDAASLQLTSERRPRLRGCLGGSRQLAIICFTC